MQTTTTSVASKTVVFNATLTSGQERPNPSNAPAEAGGHFHAQLDGTTLKWTLTVTHLSGPATSAHIHVGGSASNGVIAARLCGPCAAFVTGAVILTPSVASALLAGDAYVNVDTAANPKGEIRGQIVRG
ncbi:MAG TPA: CHRD domain-containing protein [Fimbriimonas sp.]|nr:CHRD domain-containing protein [Fimbriimonas sp.]